MKQYQKTLLVWLVFGLFIVTVWSFFGKSNSNRQEKPFSEFLSSVEDGHIKTVTIIGQDFTGENKDGSQFHSTGVVTDHILDTLSKANKKYGTEYQLKKEEGGTFWLIVAQWLPMLLIIGLFMFFMRQIQVGGGRAMSFGKSRARMMTENQSKVTFKNVAGVDECKLELQEIVEFLKDPKKFTRLGGRIPKGVLLMGPPGTGKTLLARAIAGEAAVPFFSIAGSDFVEMFVGVGASRVRDLFEQGKKNAPCIIFIDEIDAVGRQRGAGMGGGHDEREQTLNQMLVEMDGFEANEGVIIIAATNRPDVLDPAILRPGRFDRRVVVPLPDVRGREEIFKVHTVKVPLAEDVDLSILARSTPGMSGADIENLVNESALIAAREGKDQVSMYDFEMAREKIIMGAERRNLVMSRKDIENTAFHEAGHALVSALIRRDAEKEGVFDTTDPVHKVTIIPRGRALGVTMQLPTDDRYNLSKTYALNQIAVMMGGRLAEEIKFKEITSGAGNDIEKATDLAQRMVREWGMSEKMGPLVYGKKEGQIFLGKDISQASDYSEVTAQEIDKEIKSIVNAQYERAKKLLTMHLDMLERVGKALLEYETIDGNELLVLMDGEELKREKPLSRVKTREELNAEREMQEAQQNSKSEYSSQVQHPEPELKKA
ncbi:MAG: ATP-dependent zinc metalloprotease FtsH [Myxococcales bacterium]|nr:ATP-dependent zinc metalloprotease FtsH [Myxococcales bacterium]USN50881.1 MAG: ATP-dependent metallopeptidase FtsH/Yme1/Tma family protein [Myxococcales bacterium]